MVRNLKIPSELIDTVAGTTDIFRLFPDSFCPALLDAK